MSRTHRTVTPGPPDRGPDSFAGLIPGLTTATATLVFASRFVVQQYLYDQDRTVGARSP
ncbi:hypothetical protein AB0F91_20030 [Amycolatopsis sp. NPDC023774]|uniref:hypothetical protein n=1 Tax=Amycolatopsis sp. NPDC023774 TaxID=3155015 RepID=UPI003410DBCD